MKKDDTSVKIGNLSDARITPESFEIIETACLGEKHMYHGVVIVYDNPLRVGISVIVVWFDATVLKKIVAHAVGHCGHMLRRGALAYHEARSGRALYVAEIHDGDMFALSVLYTFDYHREQVSSVVCHEL